MSFLSQLKKLLRRRAEEPEVGVVPSATDASLPVPRHVAIIMDGNNRWAKQRGLGAGGGHRAGVEIIRNVLEICQQRGISALTLFAFSSENWLRPESEVRELMSLLRNYLQREIQSLHKKGMRVRFIGRRDRIASDIVDLMRDAEQKTAANTAGSLVLAIDYGGRWDVAQAASALAAQVQRGELDPQAIDESMLDQAMSMSDLPAPDLCIRTGAEHRLSNFLLWQLSYAELYFCDCYWPDFNADEFNRALLDFGTRQRRYGMSGSQVDATNTLTDADSNNPSANSTQASTHLASAGRNA